MWEAFASKNTDLPAKTKPVLQTHLPFFRYYTALFQAKKDIWILFTWCLNVVDRWAALKAGIRKTETGNRNPESRIGNYNTETKHLLLEKKLNV